MHVYRLPDVFKDLECDISLHNQLAVANTKLLRAYGGIDPRVRALVFVIKYWAKRRHLNSPSDGTLSSYGFILCLIHFLQVTSPALFLCSHEQSQPFLTVCFCIYRIARSPWFPTCKPCRPHGLAPARRSPQRRPPRRGSTMTRSSVPTSPQSTCNSSCCTLSSLSSNRRTTTFCRRCTSTPRTVCAATHISTHRRQHSPTSCRYVSLLPQYGAHLKLTMLRLLSCHSHFTQAYARQNTETVGELLVEFFRYFCWTFDMRHSVVSIRQPRGLSKVDKAEQDGWLQNDTLA
jgi:hypothetical protein